MRAVRDICLEASGFDMSHYHQESFNAPVAVLPAPLAASDMNRLPEARRPSALPTSKAIASRPDGAAGGACQRRAHFRSLGELACAARARVRKFPGEVEMNHNGGIRPQRSTRIHPRLLLEAALALGDRGMTTCNEETAIGAPTAARHGSDFTTAASARDPRGLAGCRCRPASA